MSIIIIDKDMVKSANGSDAFGREDPKADCPPVASNAHSILRKCVMEDYVPQSHVPHYEVEENTFGLDAHQQVISFLSNTDVIAPTFELNVDTFGDVSQAISAREDEIIFKVLSTKPVQEVTAEFGTNEFFNNGFWQVELLDLVCYSILVHPDDSELCRSKCGKDIFQGNKLWTADVIEVEHMPRNTAMFLPDPHTVGVLGITSEWAFYDSPARCCAKLSLLVQTNNVVWHKGQ